MASVSLSPLSESFSVHSHHLITRVTHHTQNVKLLSCILPPILFCTASVSKIVFTMDSEGRHIKDQIQTAFGHELDYDSLYTLLGITSAATTAEIKRAYRRMALKYHPDRGGDAEKFKALSVCVLSV